MKTAKKTALFCLGGGAYVTVELLFRGYSHVSMFLAGGTCFLFLGRLRRLPRSPGAKLLLGAGIITAVELITGLLVNRSFTVWDYRDQPGNFLGQICPLFTAAWVPVSAAAMGLYRLGEGLWDRAEQRLRARGRFLPEARGPAGS